MPPPALPRCRRLTGGCWSPVIVHWHPPARWRPQTDLQPLRQLFGARRGVGLVAVRCPQLVPALVAASHRNVQCRSWIGLDRLHHSTQMRWHEVGDSCRAGTALQEVRDQSWAERRPAAADASPAAACRLAHCQTGLAMMVQRLPQDWVPMSLPQTCPRHRAAAAHTQTSPGSETSFPCRMSCFQSHEDSPHDNYTAAIYLRGTCASGGAACSFTHAVQRQLFRKSIEVEHPQFCSNASAASRGILCFGAVQQVAFHHGIVLQSPAAEGVGMRSVTQVLGEA